MLEDGLTNDTGPIPKPAKRPATAVSRAVKRAFECWVDKRLFDPELGIAVHLRARRAAEMRLFVLHAGQTRATALAQARSGIGSAAEAGAG